MELHELVCMLKKDYDASSKIYMKENSDYWFGRMSVLSEILNKIRPFKNSPSSCIFCYDNSDCKSCFSKEIKNELKPKVEIV